MISLEDFRQYVVALKRQSEFESKLEDLYREYRDVVGDAEAPLSSSYWRQIEMLEKLVGITQDANGYSTISWWAEETDFGQKDTEMPFAKERGLETGTKIETIEDLYAICLKEAKMQAQISNFVSTE